jgi:membrane-associated phospholipid phosphatase
MQSIFDYGLRIVTELQSPGRWPTLPMEFLSFLGTEIFYLFTLPLLYWCLNSTLGLRVAVILMVSSVLINALKLAFQGPRPYWISNRVLALGAESSFGAPSGHAQNAVAVWGMLAVWLRRGWAWGAALLIMFGIGLSRLYLAVHFPHDILTGWLIGAALLWVTVRSWDRGAVWAKRQPFGHQILVALISCLILMVIVAMPYLWLRATYWHPPWTWAAYADRAVSFDHALISAAMLFGLLIGAAWCRRQGDFEVQGRWWQLLLRYLSGLAGVLLIRFGLKLLFPESETILGGLQRFLRYALMGAWISGGAPWVFVRLKLAEKPTHVSRMC